MNLNVRSSNLLPKKLSFTSFKMPVFLLTALLSLLLEAGIAQPCNFTISGSNISPCVFNFTSQVTGVDGYLLEHLWAFGDGSTSDVANPLHSYPSVAFGTPGQPYTITHTVIVRNPFTLAQIPGSPFVCTQSVTVYSSSSCQLCPPLSEVGAIFNYSVVGCTITMQTTLPNWYTYNWSFGDGTTQTGGMTVTHTYSGDGTFTVSLGASYGHTAYRCSRTIKVDCTRPSSAFTVTTGGDGCTCFNLNVVPAEQSAGTTYGWYINKDLVATGLHPNLFAHGIDVCAIQQAGGNVDISLVVQLNGESSGLTTHTINLGSVAPAIYIGFSGGSTNLADCEGVLPGGSYCGACKVKVCGIIVVDKSFEFCGSEVEVSGGNCGFDVNQDKTLKLTGGARMHGCECIWRGIRMSPQSNIEVTGNSIIEDAAYAVDVLDNLALNPVKLTLNTGIFRNNYIGVRITGRANFLAFTGNLFTTLTTPTPPLWDDCMHLLEGLPFTRNIGFAGMFIEHQGSTLNLSNDNNLNTFRNLAVGIHSQNGTFGLDHTASFDQINTCTEYQSNHGGTGVFFQDDPSFTATGNDFRRMRTGIWGETNVHTDVSITANTMNAGTPSVARGIQLAANKQGDMDGLVSGNTILVNNALACLSNSDAYGISFFDNTSAVNTLSINQNPITFNCTITATEGILISANSLNVNTPAAIEVNVEDNTITGQRGASGIELSVARRVAVHGNTINLSGTTSIIGLNINGAESNKICFNTVTDAGSNRGLWVANARYNDIVNNILDGTDIGAFFSGDCGSSFIGCNQFKGAQTIGLQYTSTAKTDIQYNTGNNWDPGFTGVKALISTPNPDFNNNIYTVPAGPSIFNPGNTQQQSGVYWFDDMQGVGDPDCSSTQFACMGYNRPTGNQNLAERTTLANLEMTFQVVPNPNQGVCTVLFDSTLKESAMLNVVSSTGALVRSYPVAAAQSSYAIIDLQPGIYFVTLASKGKTSAPKKVVVF